MSRPQPSGLDLRAWLQRELTGTRPRAPRGVLTGFPTVDRLLGGLEKGHLAALLGTHGVGKTSLCLQFALEAARHEAVLHVSIKDEPSELCERLLSQSSTFPGLSSDPWKNLWHSLRYPFLLEDGRERWLEDLIVSIRRHARSLASRSERFGLIVVDGLEGGKGDSLAFIGQLRGLALELDAAIVVTADDPTDRTHPHGTTDGFLQEASTNTWSHIVPPTAEHESFRWLCYADVIFSLQSFNDFYVGPRRERYRMLHFSSAHIDFCLAQLSYDRDSGRIREERYLTACGKACVEVPDNEAEEWGNCDQIAASAEYLMEDDPASGMLTPSEIAWLRADKKRLAAEAKAAWAEVLSRQAHG